MRPTSLTLPAPAKLNLFLHITGRRPDGYHNLQTVFQLLDFGDELTLDVENHSQLAHTEHSNGRISITPPIDGVPLEHNLIYKAADLLRNHAGRPELGASIQLDKKLPMGGGIGGGSSNAATALVGLNYLWETDLPLSTLATLGRQLGADVPVFVEGKSAWAEGIGEQLVALDLPKSWYVVLTPDCHVSTVEIFSHKDLTRDTLDITVAAFFEKGGRNDCQPLVASLYPQVRDAVDWLNKFGPAKLTGTGASVFAAFPSKDAAHKVFANKPKHLNGFVAQGVNESPLHQRLPEQCITGV